ncbi:MAG TPA: GAF domain-containing protein [Anaerolineales bacterium]|nr:GAF domain-containing protein [Anaerolineales bacterium]
MKKMRNFLRRLFAPSIFEDEEKTRTAQTLNVFSWVTFAVVFLLTVSRILSGSWQSTSSKIFLPIILVVLLSVQVLTRYGYVRGAGRVAISMLWLSLSIQAYFSDGLRDVTVLAFPILVLLSALLLGWQTGLLTGIASILVIWLFAFQENIGIRTYSIDPPINYAGDLSVVFIITSLLTYLLIQSLNRSLSAAKLELRERLRAEEKLQTQANYLTALHETTFGLLNRLELKPLLETILLRTAHLLETPHVGIDLASVDGVVLRQEMGIGIYEQWNGNYTEKGEGLTGKVWESGNTIVVDDYETWEGKIPLVSGMGLRSVLGAPLKSGDKILGVLLVASDKPKYFTSEKVTLLERLAALASLAIDNAHLYESAQKEIRERKLVEEDLRSSEERFRKVFNNSSVAIAIVTLEDGIFLEANQAFWELAGRTPQEALGRSAVDIDLWSNPEERARFVKDLLEEGSLENVEVEFSGKSGQSKLALGYYELLDIKGQRCILCMFYDVSVQRQAQSDLKESERRTRAIISSIPDMIFEISKEGDFLDFMASAELVPIMEPHEFIGKNIKNMFPPRIGEQTMFALDRALVTGQVHAFEYGLPPGEETQFFEARVAPVTSESAIIMVRDISQRKWVETEREKLINELEEKNSESEALREGMTILVETLDETKAVSLILEQLEKVLPFDSASVQLLKGDTLEIVSTRHLEPKEMHLGTRYVVSEKEPSYPLLLGKVPYVLVKDVRATFTDLFAVAPYTLIRTWLAVPLRIKRQIIGIITLDGYQPNKFTQRHAELALTYASQVAVALDNARLFSELQVELSARKNLIEELEVKNAELERFTYTVSHDLKSPVITIRGFLGFLEQDALSGNVTRLRGDIQRIADATDKMQTLLNELLELSRIGRLVNPPNLVPFHEIVSEALELVLGRIQKNHVQVHTQDEMEAVYVDRQRMVEAVQNLIDNAAKFVGENPKIEIGQRGRDGNMLLFFIKDNGIGIPHVHHERIFGLFNKLDAISEGTGIGLALVRRIIEVHKGRIWVQSEPGQGSTFFFTLPAGPES